MSPAAMVEVGARVMQLILSFVASWILMLTKGTHEFHVWDL